MSIRDRVGKYIPSMARRPALSRKDALAITPVHNPKLTWTPAEGGETLLRIPRRADRLGRMIALVFRVPEHKELLLDEVGSSVWEMCDGKYDIGGIIEETIKQYKLNRREAEVSVTTYLKMLAERKLVALTRKGGKPRHGRR